jgi:hypothetical protein
MVVFAANKILGDKCRIETGLMMLPLPFKVLIVLQI